MDISKNERGFLIGYFKDYYGNECSIQESSLANEDCIWLGINDANPQIMASKVMENGRGWVKYPILKDVLLTTRMHLSRKQVKDLLPILKKFVDTGEI